ncbi:type II toxin-antitoxin system VapC family toxin [Geminocystis herdmanii]|uniref:type II toxin-antitoxin system VapC family toxin n=1 Tax=Geminocystis herdmanii TaxID=669359 RepID=UPI00034DBB15|nr:type II toxin-antitoxin system VapC family toxin [Geminocystis herdmanii]
MTLYILDTDTISLFQRNHPVIVSKIKGIEFANITTTIITVEEQLKGRLNSIQKAKSQPIISTAYRNLKLTIHFFDSITVLDFDENAYNIFQDLKSIRIGSQDLRISSIALAFGGVVVTRNQKDFSKIPNLQIQDWTLSNN